MSNFGQTHGTAEKRQWLKLDEHIGHKATLIGTITCGSNAQEKKEGQVEKAAGDLRISSLKMLSKTCK